MADSIAVGCSSSLTGRLRRRRSTGRCATQAVELRSLAAPQRAGRGAPAAAAPVAAGAPLDAPPSRRLRRLTAPLLLLLVAAGGCSRNPGGLPDFADLVERVSPSVVNISAIVPADSLSADELAQLQDDGADGSDGGGGYDAAPDASGAPGEMPPAPGSSDQTRPYGGGDGSGDSGSGRRGGDGVDEPQSLGSGFILSSDGYIVTNQHVVKDAKEIIVRLMDRRELRARLIGSDERSDLALLKINADHLPAAKLGDIRALRVGEWVLAIGSPFGFDYTVTAGIVSAKGRSLDDEQYVPFIQTDAAINPGNSGGPLFNMRGEVIGVNSQIYSQTGGFMGVAFSIPIDVASKVVNQLKLHGKVTRGWLGVVVQEVDRALAQRVGLDKPEGAYIARIIANSPAEQAGLRSGDVILSYDGTDLPSSHDLPAMVGSTDPHQGVWLDVFRDRHRVRIKVEIGTLDDTREEGAASSAPAAPPAVPLGLTVQSLTDAQRRSAKVISSGVLVTDVADGPGRNAGVQRGDIIISLANQEVDSADRFAQVVGRLTPGMSVPMLIQRGGEPMLLQLQVPPRRAAGRG
jgi:serine protease Do